VTRERAPPLSAKTTPIAGLPGRGLAAGYGPWPTTPPGPEPVWLLGGCGHWRTNEADGIIARIGGCTARTPCLMRHRCKHETGKPLHIKGPLRILIPPFAGSNPGAPCSATHSSAIGASFRRADITSGSKGRTASSRTHKRGGRRRVEFCGAMGQVEDPRDRRAYGVVHDHRHGCQCTDPTYS
jgi:hypothetical protein